MFQIKTKNTNSLKPSNWLRIGDLSNFEGPLLTLFQDLESNNLFLYDWVDRDKTHNRWMIYTVYADKLNQFLNKEISHFNLFQERPTQEVYVSDIDNRGMNFSQYPILELMEVPEEYMPSKENYFEEVDCVGEERIRLVVSKYLGINQLSKNQLMADNPSSIVGFSSVEITNLSRSSRYRRKYGKRNYIRTDNHDFNIIYSSGVIDLLRVPGKSQAIKNKIYANPID